MGYSEQFREKEKFPFWDGGAHDCLIPHRHHGSHPHFSCEVGSSFIDGGVCPILSDEHRRYCVCFAWGSFIAFPESENHRSRNRYPVGIWDGDECGGSVPCQSRQGESERESGIHIWGSFSNRDALVILLHSGAEEQNF